MGDDGGWGGEGERTAYVLTPPTTRLSFRSSVLLFHSCFMKYTVSSRSALCFLLSQLRGAYVRDQNSGNTNPQCKEHPALRISSHLLVAGSINRIPAVIWLEEIIFTKFVLLSEKRQEQARTTPNQTYHQPTNLFTISIL